jgi:hypothetical protein
MKMDNLHLQDHPLSRADWNGRQLASCVVLDCPAIQLRADGAHMFNVRFERSNLQGASFAHGRLLDCTFRQCNLMGADFTDCKLWNVSFAGSDLRGATGLPYVHPVPALDATLLDVLERDGAWLVPHGEAADGIKKWHLAALTAHYCASTDLRSSVGQATAAALVYYSSTGMVPDFSAPVADQLAGMRERAGR